jgi:hypothetical protein
MEETADIPLSARCSAELFCWERRAPPESPAPSRVKTTMLYCFNFANIANIAPLEQVKVDYTSSLSLQYVDMYLTDLN